MASAEPNTSGMAALLMAQPSASGSSPACFMTRLEARTARGAFSAMVPARARASSISLSAGTTRLISPRASARWASMGSPVRASSRAMAGGIRLGSRMRPPAPAIRPRLTSGIPKVASSTATTRSQESMISHPPARADPLTAAMRGLAKSRWAMPPNPPLAPMISPASPAVKALRSMPALKALSPLPVMMTTQQSSSTSSSSKAAVKARDTAPLMALRASGRLMVRISM